MRKVFSIQMVFDSREQGIKTWGLKGKKKFDDLNDGINAHKSLESIQSKWYLRIEESA